MLAKQFLKTKTKILTNVRGHLAPLITLKPTSETPRYGTRCRGFYSLSTKEIYHAFAFPAEAGLHITDPRGMKG